MPRRSHTIRDHINLVCSYLSCSYHLPCLPPPPSPPLTPQEGELEGLLGDANWRDDDDALSLHTQPGSSVRSKAYTPRTGMARFGGSSSHKIPPRFPEDENEVESAQPPIEYDEDPTDLDRSTLDRLPELARRFEPTLTLEDMAREEVLQEEREWIEGRARGSEVYPAPPLDEPDFGGFQGAEEPAAIGEENEELAEAPFGLGEEVDDSDEE